MRALPMIALLGAVVLTGATRPGHAAGGRPTSIRASSPTRQVPAARPHGIGLTHNALARRAAPTSVASTRQARPSAALEARRAALTARIAALRASRAEDAIVVPVILAANAGAAFTSFITGGPLLSYVLPASILFGGGTIVAIKIVRTVRVALARADLRRVERLLTADS
jgi:hypothetical protein